MAAPTVTTYTWDADANELTLVLSEAVSRGEAWASGVVVYGDIANREFTGGGGALEGEGTDTIVIPLTATGSRAAGSSVVNIAADALKNGTDEGIAEVTDEPIYGTLKETASGLTYDDVLALTNTLSLVTAGTLDATTAPASDNIDASIATGLLAALAKAPRTEDRAYALVDQFNKYLQSTKSMDDLKLLTAAVNELAAGLNPRGTFEMLANGT